MSIFRIEGWRFFTNFLSLLEASWPRESPRESKMSTFQKNASDLFLARPRLARRLFPCDLFHRFNLSPLSLSLSHFPYPRRLYPRSHTSLSLCRAISFARFAPTKSRKLWEGMREGEGKFFARNPRSDSPLPGPRDQPATLMMLSHRRDFWGGGKERERIYLAHHLGSR